MKKNSIERNIEIVKFQLSFGKNVKNARKNVY